MNSLTLVVACCIRLALLSLARKLVEMYDRSQNIPSKLAQAVTRGIREKTGLNPGRSTGYPE
jgi:hypothetical protein